jgi:hypothetical protein
MRIVMAYRTLLIGAMVLAASLLGGNVVAQAYDDSEYPDFKGQWRRVPVPGVRGQISFDQHRDWGKGQGAPLTPEYQAVYDNNLKTQAEGNSGEWLGISCLGFGMPIMMYGGEPIEIVITPATTYILLNWVEHGRRIYTDGRDWPASIEPTLQGYSIGKWVDTDGDGKFDVLEVETRGFKGPRHYDASQLPLHHDNQSVFKERFFLNKDNPNILHDEITVIDNALTRPWTVLREYRRNPATQPVWREFICAEGNSLSHVRIGNENYFLSADGLLMPVRKDQPPPDLKYFQPTRK